MVEINQKLLKNPVDFDIFDLLIDIFDLLIDIFDLLIKIWSNLIKNRSILIDKRSIRFDTIPFCHHILNQTKIDVRRSAWNLNWLNTVGWASSMLQQMSPL